MDENIGEQKLKKVFYGYVQISTREQKKDLQLTVIKNSKIKVEKIFVDTISGKSTERPEYKKLLSILKEGDSILFYDLSGLSRSTSDFFKLFEELNKRKIGLKALSPDQMWLDTTKGQLNSIMLTILSGFAQFERDSIRRRTLDGLASAKAQGRLGGRPCTNLEKIELAVSLAESKENTKSIASICKSFNFSKSTYYRYLRIKEQEKERTREQEKEQERERIKEKEFLLRGKCFLLTYSRCGQELTKEIVLEFLMLSRKRLKNYVIGKEMHEDGGFHIHACVEFEFSFDEKSCHTFDIQIGSNKEYHPNIKKIEKRKFIESVNYALKEKDFLTNFFVNESGKIVELETRILELAKVGKIKEALELVRSEVGDKNYFEKVSKYVKILNAMFLMEEEDKKRLEKKDLSSIPNLESFCFEEEEVNYEILNYFLNKGCGFESLIIAGKSQMGKTTLGLSITKAIVSLMEKSLEKEVDFLLLSEINGLRNYDETVHKILLIDNMDFSRISKEQRIHLLGNSKFSTDIRIRNKNVTLAPYTVKIITTNDIKKILKRDEVLINRSLILFVDKAFKWNVVNPTLGISVKDINCYPYSSNGMEKNNNMNNRNESNNIININLVVGPDEAYFSSKKPESMRKLVQEQYENAYNYSVEEEKKEKRK